MQKLPEKEKHRSEQATDIDEIIDTLTAAEQAEKLKSEE